jgi:hypothetical protein
MCRVLHNIREWALTRVALPLRWYGAAALALRDSILCITLRLPRVLAIGARAEARYGTKG